LAAYAFCCHNLLYHKQKTKIIFPQKGRKKKEEEKDMQVQQQCSGSCQGFLK